MTDSMTTRNTPWRLDGPWGRGREVGGAQLARLRFQDGALVWQVVRGAPPAGFSEPLVFVGRRPPGEGWERHALLPSWATGPDPFVPTQPALESPGPRHDALALRVLQTGRAAVQTWSGSRVDEGRVVSRGAAWLRWRLAEPGAELEAMEVRLGERCSGWVLLGHSSRSIRILDLIAEDRGSHYALLKAARRRSWERGGLPVVLHGERMSRRYAFTAGYVPAPPALAVWTAGGVALDAVWEADAP